MSIKNTTTRSNRMNDFTHKLMKRRSPFFH